MKRKDGAVHIKNAFPTRHREGVKHAVPLPFKAPLLKASSVARRHGLHAVSGVPATAYWQGCVRSRAPGCIPRALRYRLAPTGDSLYRGMTRVLVPFNAYGRIIKRVREVVKPKLWRLAQSGKLRYNRAETGKEWKKHASYRLGRAGDPAEHRQYRPNLRGNGQRAASGQAAGI